ncbi:MAG: hypothetical protein IT183_04925 [Acidobacteria bacterium]|nr:hypothetical protein [Acidobacteriota bacterium]
MARGLTVEALPPSLGFRFERFDHPRLAELLARERLRDRIHPGATPFEQILSLKDWVAGQWPPGYPSPYPPWDALIVLDWIRAGTTGGFCAQYSQLLLQSLAALGFTARYVEIGSVDNPYAHYVVEVWSPDFNKWVLMDADYNLHFERAGVPLSALEVHDALLESKATDLDVVRGTVREGHSRAEAWPLRTAELYHYVRYHLKANHLSEPDELPFDRYDDMVEWLDDRVVPWSASTVESPYPKERLTRRTTRDRRLAEPPLSQIQTDDGRVR